MFTVKLSSGLVSSPTKPLIEPTEPDSRKSMLDVVAPAATATGSAMLFVGLPLYQVIGKPVACACTL